MKVKRFKNLWTMGLILCGAILVFFYVAKIFFPEFIVGVAEIPEIVKFGNFIDGNIVYRTIFDIFSAYITIGIYFCACCRKIYLRLKGNLILLGYCVILSTVLIFIPQYYTHINYLGLIFCPFLICLIDNKLNRETFISTALCFTIDIITQIMSLSIRDITIIANNLNTATFTILLIDVVIWRALLYCFYNYKKGDK